MRLWIILIDWFLEDKRVCMWFECSTKINFNSNLLGALVGLDRGSKYCTIRVRESEYALATATPTEASTMKSAADAAVLPGFERWWWCDDSRYTVCCFDEGVRGPKFIFVSGYFAFGGVSRAHESREVCVWMCEGSKNREYKIVEKKWKEKKEKFRTISQVAAKRMLFSFGDIIVHSWNGRKCIVKVVWYRCVMLEDKLQSTGMVMSNATIIRCRSGGGWRLVWWHDRLKLAKWNGSILYRLIRLSSEIAFQRDMHWNMGLFYKSFTVWMYQVITKYWNLYWEKVVVCSIQ